MSWRTRIASVLLRYRRRNLYERWVWRSARLWAWRRARRCAYDWAQLAAAAIRAEG